MNRLTVRYLLPFTIILVAAAMVGCSSSAPPAPVRTAPAAAGPAATAEPAVAATPPADRAWVTVYRKKRVLGAALNTSVYVDGIEVADLDPGTYVRVQLEPGKHTFHGDEDKDRLELDLAPGQHQFLRVELVAGMWKGHGVLVAVAQDEGAAQFDEWKLKLAKDIRKPEMVIRDPGKA